MKIPAEDVTDVILVIIETYGDDVRGGNRIIMEDDKVADGIDDSQ